VVQVEGESRRFAGIAVAVTVTPDRASVGVMAFCPDETMVIEEPP